MWDLISLTRDQTHAPCTGPPGQSQASVFEHSGPRPAKEERASEQENAWSPVIMSEKKKATSSLHGAFFVFLVF